VGESAIASYPYSPFHIPHLFRLQKTTCLESGGRVNRRSSLFDVANDAFLVDHERGARAEALGFVEDAVVLDDLALLEVAE